MIRTMTITTLALLALPLLQGCCCCCNGCPGPSSSSSSSWGDDLGELIAEETIEGLTGTELDIDDKGGTISMETPDGTMNLSGGPGTDYPEALPLKQYPGSSVEGGMDFSGGTETMITVALKSSDSMDTIDSWYSSQLGADLQRMEMTQDGQQAISLTKVVEGGQSVVVVIGEESELSRLITITAVKE